MDQLVQIVGALLILVAYAAAQFGAMSQHSRAYLVLNLIGSAVLAVLAFYEELWGFLLLETVWAAVSLWGLIQLARGRPLSAGS
jgi:uncharacterized membrane protein YccC